MEFNKLINKRQSIRTFKDKEVPEKDIKKILEAAIRAPSAGNLQAYEMYVIKDEETKNRLSGASLGQDSIKEASVCIVFCAHPKRSSVKYEERGRDLYCLYDTAIACAYAQLEVTNLGYGSVWVSAFEDDKVRKVLDINESLIPVSILPIGISNETPEYKSRREYNEIVHNL